MSTMKRKKGKATAEDQIIGQRLRQVRKIHKLSQPAVGQLVDLSFQQIQKYERGMDRVSATRLRDFARVYNRPYAYFLDDLRADRIRQETHDTKSKDVLPLLQLCEQLPTAVRGVAMEQACRVLSHYLADSPERP